MLDIVAYAYNLNTREAEAGGLCQPDYIPVTNKREHILQSSSATFLQVLSQGKLCYNAKIQDIGFLMKVTKQFTLHSFSLEHLTEVTLHIVKNEERARLCADDTVTFSFLILLTIKIRFCQLPGSALRMYTVLYVFQNGSFKIHFRCVKSYTNNNKIASTSETFKKSQYS